MRIDLKVNLGIFYLCLIELLCVTCIGNWDINGHINFSSAFLDLIKIQQHKKISTVYFM